MAAAILATLRRDGPSVIAMLFASSLAGNLAGLPQGVLAPCCAVLMIAMSAGPMGAILSRLAGASNGFMAGAGATVSILILGMTPSAVEAGAPSWETMKTAGTRIEASIAGLARRSARS